MKSYSGIKHEYRLEAWETENSTYYRPRYTKEAKRIMERVRTAAVGTEIEVISESTFLGKKDVSSIKYRVTGTQKNKVLEEVQGSKKGWKWYGNAPETRINLSRETATESLLARFGDGNLISIRRTPLTRKERKDMNAERTAERRQFKFKF